MRRRYSYGFVTQGYDYSRSGNPTRECFEQCIASIDGAKYGMALFLSCYQLIATHHVESE